MPMSVRGAFDALAALSVAGIAHSYPLESLPDRPARPQLPALLVLPFDTDGARLFEERSQGFEAVAFSGGAHTVQMVVHHLLLLTPLASAGGWSVALPTLVDQIDAYVQALAADPTLGGALLEPAQVQIEPGPVRYGGQDYLGCTFRHRWLLAVTPQAVQP